MKNNLLYKAKHALQYAPLCVPVGFLALYVDATMGNIGGYFTVAPYVVYSIYLLKKGTENNCIKTCNSISILLSCILANANLQNQAPYFKPFSVLQLILLLSTLIFAIQLPFMLKNKKAHMCDTECNNKE
ncbi:MAG: hypothetical protein SPL05_02645 [Eubacteriales bacterium]|nr:hypothetical protein [Eubacteriales bacterium]